jgi:hypothetical protein
MRIVQELAGRLLDNNPDPAVKFEAEGWMPKGSAKEAFQTVGDMISDVTKSKAEPARYAMQVLRSLGSLPFVVITVDEVRDEIQARLEDAEGAYATDDQYAQISDADIRKAIDEAYDAAWSESQCPAQLLYDKALDSAFEAVLAPFRTP